MDKLQFRQALECSSYLGLASAVPTPMFFGTQPPYATNPLTIDKVRPVSRLTFLYKTLERNLMLVFGRRHFPFHHYLQMWNFQQITINDRACFVWEK